MLDHVPLAGGLDRTLLDRMERHIVESDSQLARVELLQEEPLVEDQLDGESPQACGKLVLVSKAVLACSQRVGLRAEFPAASASGQASTAAPTAPREALSAPAHSFIYRMAVLGSFLSLPDSSTLECLALFLPRDGMILMFENSCHGKDCCGCCFGLPGSSPPPPGDRCA